MAGVVPANPKIQFFSSTGAPLATGTVDVYLAGTVTRSNTWQDLAQGTLNANPIELNSRGEASIYLDGALTYKFVLKNAGGVEQYTVDNISGVGALNGVTFLQAGTGAVARTAQDKMRETVNATDFMTTAQKADVLARTALVDVTAAVQAAATYADSIGAALYIPTGVYLISSTVTFAAGMRVYGDGMDNSVFKPSITNSTACIQISGDHPEIENWSVASGLNSANYLAGTATAQACTGIALGTAAAYCNRWHISSVRVFGCAIGWYVRGFIGTADNMWANYCDLGLSGTEINSTDLNLRLENCIKSYAITNSDGVLFRQMLDEGGHTAPVAATIDDCNGVHFDAPYWEYGVSTPRANPYLKIGGTTICRGVKMSGINLVAYVQTGVPGIDVDLCDGLDIQGNINIGQRLRSIRTTANTKNVRIDIVNQGDLWPQDDSKQLGPAYNYFANPNFDLWYRGNWAASIAGNCVVSQETTLVRKGRNAIRITASAAAASNRNVWWLEGAPAVALRGKTARVWAWVWVPDIAAYPVTGRTKFPSVLISSYNGAATVAGTTVNTKATVNTWNLMFTDVAVQSDATRIVIDVWANHSGNAADGTEYVVCDSIYVTESSVPLSRVMNGAITDHPSVNCTAVGSRMVAVGSAAPTDAEQTFVVGDQVWNDATAAGGSPGWVCTTAGVGGVAVFKAMAAVAA